MLKVNRFKHLRFVISENKSDDLSITANYQVQNFEIAHLYLLKTTYKKHKPKGNLTYLLHFTTHS